MHARHLAALGCLLAALIGMGSNSGRARDARAAGQPASDICVGECTHNGAVSVDDLVTGVNIALGIRGVDACPEFDANGDGDVTIDELVQAVNNALTGCPTQPTATATLAGSATFTETPTDTATPVATATDTPTAEATATDTATPDETATDTATPGETATDTATPAPTGTDTQTPTPHVPFCNLPGSRQSTANGLVVVPGGPTNTPDLSFLHIPVGFCAHYFARVGNTRQLRFAPGGELFVASPITGTTGGGLGGQAAIIVLPDDDHDGVADAPVTFLRSLQSTQGLLFANGYLYYQDHTKIMRVPYTAGDRVAAGPSEQVADITIYTSGLHWPKTLDLADDGTIYVGNGGDQGEFCTPTHPFHGGILKLDGSPGGTPVAKGLRNPISVRCAHGHNLCFAVELARDFSADIGGREKLFPIRQDDDWGFPCCATKDQPFPDITPKPDCSGVATEGGAFIIGETPFDLDFETGKWPAPWNHRVYVPLHGAAGSWTGARVVAIGMDPITGELIPGSDLPGEANGTFAEFATGWDDGTLHHGRPANVAFAADGRLFLGNDNNGVILWIAPLDL
jgi:glucose/arabinose dehydrogenase